MFSRLLLTLVLCPSLVLGAQLSMRTNIAGPECNHIEVSDETGTVLKGGLVIDDLLAPITDFDDPIMVQIKNAIQNGELKVSDFDSANSALMSKQIEVTAFKEETKQKTIDSKATEDAIAVNP